MSNSKIRQKREEKLKAKVDELKKEGRDSSKAERKYEAQKQRNIDIEKYRANQSTKKLVAKSLLLNNLVSGQYDSYRAMGHGRVRSALQTSFGYTPVGLIYNKGIDQRKKYGAFVW